MTTRITTPEDATRRLAALGIDIDQACVGQLDSLLRLELIDIVLELRPFGVEHRRPMDPAEAGELRARGRVVEQQLALVTCLFDDPTDIVTGRATGFGTSAERARWAAAYGHGQPVGVSAKACA